MIPSTPTSTLFPYTTLFRSIESEQYGTTTSSFRQLRRLLGSGVSSSRGLYRQGRGTGFRRCDADGEASASFRDRKSTRLNSSHVRISYAVFCLKKKTIDKRT